ncbi:MAG: ribonuclease HII [Chloroflexota bacterium]|jgi:ribonuclease HII
MPSLDFEEAVASKSGTQFVAGLDEAGRGAIAGPVVAAAVILPLDDPWALAQLSEVDDSKKLPARKRELLYDQIVQLARSFGIASSSADEVDEHGIIGATKLAMRRALLILDPPAEFLLIDGRIRLKELALPQQSLIRGDAKSLSIAAASILAKVTRDREMLEQQRLFPVYGFARHKGYCTWQHVAALTENGPCPIHRRSFAPIRQKLL